MWYSAQSPQFLEEMINIANLARPPAGYGWLTPTIGCLEMAQCITQAMGITARKSISQGTAKVGAWCLLSHRACMQAWCCSLLRALDVYSDTMHACKHGVAPYSGMCSNDAEDHAKCLQHCARDCTRCSHVNRCTKFQYLSHRP